MNKLELTLKNHIDSSIEDAMKYKSKISNHPGILSLRGMSSHWNRHLMNNLCNIGNLSYLEIGCWWGSTFISANYQNNPIQSIAIDKVIVNDPNVDPVDENGLLGNCNKFLPPNSFKFFKEDSFEIDIKKTFDYPINVYFYDGWHSPEAQYEALTYYYDIYDDYLIWIIDDYGWEEVPESSKKAIKDLDMKIIHERELQSPLREGPKKSNVNDRDTWWNGLGIFLLKK